MRRPQGPGGPSSTASSTARVRPWLTNQGTFVRSAGQGWCAKGSRCVCRDPRGPAGPAAQARSLDLSPPGRAHRAHRANQAHRNSSRAAGLRRPCGGPAAAPRQRGGMRWVCGAAPPQLYALVHTWWARLAPPMASIWHFGRHGSEARSWLRMLAAARCLRVLCVRGCGAPLRPTPAQPGRPSPFRWPPGIGFDPR